jgi:flagellar hook-associated protein 3 FlgL
MRITNRMMTQTMLRNLNGNLNRLETLHNQITTGKRISRPSDDPPALARALSFSSGIAAGDQFIRTMDSSLSWLNATEDAMGSATNLLQKARELAVQGANDALTRDQQQNIAVQIEEILKQAVTIGNAGLRGERLFGGFRIDQDPFTATGAPITAVAYGGDAGAMLREYDAGATIQINAVGTAVFPPTFTALINLRDNLNAGNSAAVSGQSIVEIDAAMDTLMSARAENGAKVNRLEQAKDRQELLQVNLQDLLSKTQDTDMADAISKFSIQETLYKASLEAASKAIQPSLLDYIR